MKICPVCGEENDDSLVTCKNFRCRRILPCEPHDVTTIKGFLTKNFHLFVILGIFGAFIFYLIQFIASFKKQDVTPICINFSLNMDIHTNVNITNTTNFTPNVSTFLTVIKEGNNTICNNASPINPNPPILFSDFLPILKTPPDIILGFLLMFSFFIFLSICLVIFIEFFKNFQQIVVSPDKLKKIQFLFFQSFIIIFIFIFLLFIWIFHSQIAFTVIALIISALIMIGMTLLFQYLFFKKWGFYVIAVLTLFCLFFPLLIAQYIMDSFVISTPENFADLLNIFYLIKFIALGILYSSFFGVITLLLFPFRDRIRARFEGRDKSK